MQFFNITSNLNLINIMIFYANKTFKFLMHLILDEFLACPKKYYYKWIDLRTNIRFRYFKLQKNKLWV
jgi:hypothetical protein